MKRSPLKRGTPLKCSTKGLKRGAPMKRGQRLKAFNVKRQGKRFPKGSMPEYRAFVRTFPCVLAGLKGHKCFGDVVFMHVRNDGNGGGDYGNGLPGCAIAAHEDQHGHGIKSWAQKWFAGTVETLVEMAQVYAGKWDAKQGLVL